MQACPFRVVVVVVVLVAFAMRRLLLLLPWPPICVSHTSLADVNNVLKLQSHNIAPWKLSQTILRSCIALRSSVVISAAETIEPILLTVAVPSFRTLRVWRLHELQNAEETWSWCWWWWWWKSVCLKADLFKDVWTVVLWTSEVQLCFRQSSACNYSHLGLKLSLEHAFL